MKMVCNGNCIEIIVKELLSFLDENNLENIKLVDRIKTIPVYKL